MLCSAQFLHSGDLQEVRSDTLDLCAHAHQHFAELLEIWFAGRIVDCSCTLRKSCSHENVSCTGHRCLVKKHVLSFKGLSFRHAEIECLSFCVVLLGCTQVHETENVCIHASAADLVSTRLWEVCPSKTGKERTYHHHRTAKFCTSCHEIHTHDVISIDLVSLECISALLMTGHLHTHTLKKQNKISHIQNLRNIGNRNLLLGQKHCTDNLQRLILRSLWSDFTTKLMSSFYYE